MQSKNIITKTLVDFVAQFEGYSATVYKDIAGFTTIGFGHKLGTSDIDRYKHSSISLLTKSQSWLKQDLEVWGDYINCISEKYECPFNINQFNALCSFCYNTGYFKPDMLQRFEDKDLKAVGSALTLYDKARINSHLTVVAGLLKRRKLEQKLYFTKVKEL